jgi:methylaspartate ammonia-lyase
MSSRIAAVRAVEGLASFFSDDQAAIRAGAIRDGLVYWGAPVTNGYRQIRQPAEALSVLLVLEDGLVAHGDCASVQYSGVAGRAEPFSAAKARAVVEETVAPLLVGHEVETFRATMELITKPLADRPGATAILYGVSQALLDARAKASRRTAAEVIVDEFRTGVTLRPVPIFAQCGEDRYLAVDAMILKQVDVLPHGLINNVEALLGIDGTMLMEYVSWLSTRIRELRDSDDYRPVLHIDTYGTPGIAFGTVARVGEYLARLGAAAAPFALRVEHPIDGGSREAQIDVLGELRGVLRRLGSDVEIVADEWCNTLADVRAFVDAGAADMIQVKTPDLGGLDQTVLALRYCVDHGVKAYCGGTCAETDRSAVLSVHVAMACGAHQLLAKPGMGADVGLSIVRNEMARVMALAG